ncbi:MAG: 4Fe-4S dicluster domain-containing protein, partial [Gammaproteobacteria bacterium]
MTSGGKKLFVCNCEGTMPLDAKALGKACGENIHVHRQLCRAELGNVESGAAGGDPLLVCCTQEAPVFTETLQQANPETAVTFTNIRERAGWSDEADAATPKIAALLAEAALDVPPARAITLVSEGRVLVYGRDEGAVAAAKQLASRLDATVLLSRPEDVLPPSVTDVALFKGTITAAKGHLGAFEVTVDDYAPPRPFSRAGLEFEAAKNGVGLRFDVILDVAGEAPLFPAPEKRDGYFKPDPGNPAAVQKALFDIADLVGEFEKPIYFAFDANLCAHSRSGVVGCTRCLDVCPTSAISPDGDHVIIDPHICAGCGSCASVCPTGAVTYALPPKEVLFQRLRTLLRTYRKAGGQDPVLLVHDTRHGDEMINMMGRFGRGLPARVLPFAVNEVTQIGFDFLSTAVAYGAERVPILIGPQNRDELTGLEEQIDLVEAALTGLGYGSGRVAIIDAEDPEAVSERLYGFESMSPIPPADFLPMGGNRTLATLALRHLHDNAPQPQDILPLTQGSPFGAVEVDVEGCTLCLA